MHIRNHYANELRRNTQINYANHYAAADYAIITPLLNYANTITQFLKKLLRRRLGLRKCQIQLRINSGHYAMGNLLSDGDS